MTSSDAKQKVPAMIDTVPSIAKSELEVGDLLGQGNFCLVHEAKMVLAARISSESSDDVEYQGDCFGRYALKRLRKPTERHGKALADEARVLSQLPRHKNIITLRAISQGFWETPEHGFLVLDLLKETLRQAVAAWKRGRSHMPPTEKIRRLLTKPSIRTRLRREAQAKRISKAMVGLARAMQHLHEYRIIFRDLKPENAAFDDETGEITLFDFGIAQTLHDGQNTIHPSRVTGTSRYLAPEVVMKQPFGLSSDVHSFAMVLFEVCCLEKPFSNAVTVDGLNNMLLNKIRPKLWSVASPNVARLLTQCWDPEPSRRPGFSYIVHELEQEVHAVEKEHGSRFPNSSVISSVQVQ